MLPDSLLDPLREHLQTLSYLPRTDHFAFFGICPACLEHGHPHEDEPE
jgi:hypothetical protein